MPVWMQPVANSRPGRFISHMVRRYFAHDVGRQGAALAYYLLFTIFPFLIFLSSLLGLLDLDISGITQADSYLSYVSATSSASMLWFGLFFSIYFPMRAADCLMQAVRRAYRLPAPKNQIAYTCKVLLYTIFLLLSVALTLALATVGEWALQMVKHVAALPDDFIRHWIDWRFVALGVVMFAAVGILYAAAQDQRQPARQVVPGVCAALAGWMVVSAVYSFYVENFASYSIIYGTLGTVIVLMVWLNLSAVALILGAEVNDTLLAMRLEKQKIQKQPETASGEEKAL